MVFRLYPEELPSSGRITQQLMYVNPEVEENILKKKILMWNGLVSWGGVQTGQHEFSKQNCPVDSCEIVTDRSEASTADLILFKDNFYSRPKIVRPINQIWMIYMLGRILLLINFVITIHHQSVLIIQHKSVTNPCLIGQQHIGKGICQKNPLF